MVADGDFFPLFKPFFDSMFLTHTSTNAELSSSVVEKNDFFSFLHIP